MADLDLRVSDQEREAVVETLRAHAAEGRLDPDELDERLTAAYTAKTRRELAGLTRDLPDPGAAPPQPPSLRQRMFPLVSRLVILNVFLVLVWLFSSGPGNSFWPIWVMLVSFVAILNRATHEMVRIANAGNTSPRARGRGRRRDRGRRR